MLIDVLNKQCFDCVVCHMEAESHNSYEKKFVYQHICHNMIITPEFPCNVICCCFQAVTILGSEFPTQSLMDSRYIINRKTAETDCNSQLSLEKQIFSSTGTSLLLILKVHERSCGIFKVMVTTTMSMCATVLQIMRVK